MARASDSKLVIDWYVNSWLIGGTLMVHLRFTSAALWRTLASITVAMVKHGEIQWLIMVPFTPLLHFKAVSPSCYIPQGARELMGKPPRMKYWKPMKFIEDGRSRGPPWHYRCRQQPGRWNMESLQAEPTHNDMADLAALQFPFQPMHDMVDLALEIPMQRQ